MEQSDPPKRRYGSERLCPYCGTRVAQKARTCFFCGGSLEEAPRRRLSIRWADVVLFAVIGGLLLFWWVRRPDMGGEQDTIARGVAGQVVAATATPDVLAELAEMPPTAVLSPTPTLQSEMSAGASPTPMAAPSPAGIVPTGPIRHTVKAGDTVLSIAAAYGSTAKDIISSNGLNASGFIRIGQELLIPVAGASGGPGPTATPSGGTLIYMVQAGDTVSLIAERFGSTMEWIFKANNLKPTSILHIGQSLQVPLSNVTPTPAPTAVQSPSPTPTPGLPFAAPSLLIPANEAVVTSFREVLLTWTSVGTLAKDQWYVVTLQTPASPGAIAPFWTKASSWRVPTDLRPAGRAPVYVVWQVQVLTGSPGNPGEPASPPSSSRRFRWE
jgi:LysM repeat protein